MGDGYKGPVKVADDEGNVRVLEYGESPEEKAIKSILLWSQSETISEMVKDTDPENTIPLASVSKEALDKVVEYMEKMAGFKADGTSDEDKQQWVSEYKKTMESQEKLPLLFQTMTAANFMNVKTLLDELCKFVAEMIAERTPNEILDFFNIKKDATYGEERKLITTHTWIDPEGLIMENYEREAERLKKEKPDYEGKSTEEVINLSRGITLDMVTAMQREEATERGAAAAEARMGRG